MNQPHVVFLPFPLQGHVKPFLTLAELISSQGLRVTFINSHFFQSRLQRSTNLSSFHHRFPNFRFISISDGLPLDHPRSGPRARDLSFSTGVVMRNEFREVMVGILAENGPTATSSNSSSSCVIIVDGFMSFGVDVGEELGVPVLGFITICASSTWIYAHLSTLVQLGEVPFQGDDMDKPITCIPGLENILRRRDLPGPCRFTDANNIYVQFFITVLATIRRSRGLILNTFQSLEAPLISKLASAYPKLYAIGPLHGYKQSPSPASSGILRAGDENCLSWLDNKLPSSVLYISFGSLVGITRAHLLEIWHGLVNSGKHFLWVMRPDAVLGEESLGNIPQELEIGTGQRGLIVDWAPQVQVLAHPSIGGFMTHSGWNSTLESILAGVPMICWPGMGDQFVNSRLVGCAWEIGIDMKDTNCDRGIVEKMVRDFMDVKREEIMVSMSEISSQAKASLLEGGSSFEGLNRLIEDLKSMALGTKI